VLGLTQTRIKRLFAYSTISHVGFILLALGVNTVESSKAFMFYLMQYTITNINGFMILVAIGFSLYLYANNNLIYTKLKDKNNSPIQLISQIKGYFYINPILAICLSVVMLSFAGIPPFVGFFAKLMVFSSALDNGFIFLVLIAVITSVIGAVYYLGIIKTMFFDKNEYEKYNLDLNVTLSSYLSAPISILTLLILLFILIPNELLNLSDILSVISYTDSMTSFEKKTGLFLTFTSDGKFILKGSSITDITNAFNNMNDTINSINNSINNSVTKIPNVWDTKDILESNKEMAMGTHKVWESVVSQVDNINNNTQKSTLNFPNYTFSKYSFYTEPFNAYNALYNPSSYYTNITVSPLEIADDYFSSRITDVLDRPSLNPIIELVEELISAEDVISLSYIIKALLEQGE